MSGHAFRAGVQRLALARVLGRPIPPGLKGIGDDNLG